MGEVQEYVDIGEYTTFKVSCVVRYFIRVHTVEALKEALLFAQEKQKTVCILGGGSNTIFVTQKKDDVCVLKIEIDFLKVLEESDTHVSLEVGAGVSWDSFVLFSVERGYAGIEALSAIPGSVGATPVQNVGAYGVEVKDVITQVTVLNTETGSLENLSHASCEFGYRQSIFKTPKGKKYIIVSVTFILSKNQPVRIPTYQGVAEYVSTHGITTPTLFDIRNAITEIRWMKLPDPSVLASCGSFFKNPIIETSKAHALKETYPELVVHDMENGFSKLGAGWLIEKAGYKGKVFTHFSVYDKNALVLVHLDGGTEEELSLVIKEITDAVFSMFGVLLEPEPVFV